MEATPYLRIGDYIYRKSSLVDQSYNKETLDYVKSLQSLVKNNEGKWKSSKQAKFLWLRLSERDPEELSPPVKSWIDTHLSDDPNEIAVPLLVFDTRYGHKNPSKIRYWGYIYILDGAGIKAAAKLAVKFKGGLDDGRPVAESIKEETFIRRGNPPILFDAEGHMKALEEEERKREERKETNKVLISKIKTIPGYSRSDFFKSLVYQLERGDKLSPRQMAIILKKLPAGDVLEEDDYTRIRELASALDKKVEELILEGEKLPPQEPEFYTTDWKGDPLPPPHRLNFAGYEKADLREAADKLRKAWKSFKAKPLTRYTQKMYDLYGDLGHLFSGHEVGDLGDVGAVLSVALKGSKSTPTALKKALSAEKYVRKFLAAKPWLRTVEEMARDIWAERNGYDRRA